MTFGKKVREARKSKGLTQRQLAEAIGAKHNSVSDWENDKNKPDPDTIELLCGILDITPNYLLANTAGEISPSEKLLIKKYRALDAHGREMVDFTLEKEYERSRKFFLNEDIDIKYHPSMVAESRVEYGINAAHGRTDINIPAGTDTTEDDIMDDENF